MGISIQRVGERLCDQRDGGNVEQGARDSVRNRWAGACDCIASFGQVCLRCERQRTVAAFTVDSLDGSLTPVPGSPYTVARQDRERCWRLIGGDVLYVAGGSSLHAFAIDSTAGGLSAATGSPYSFNASSVTVDPSGTF